MPDVRFIPQDFSDLRNGPFIPSAFRLALVDVGKGAVPLEVEPSGSGYLFGGEYMGNPGGPSALESKSINLFYNPLGFIVHQ